MFYKVRKKHRSCEVDAQNHLVNSKVYGGCHELLWIEG